MALISNGSDPGYENAFFSAKDPIRLVYAIVDSNVLVFGIALNAMLIYLIRTETVAAMKQYSKLLTVSCAMDLIVSVWNFILQPIPCVDHGYRMILVNGYVRYHSQPVRYAVYLTWIHLMQIFLVTTMCQYVYRFCVLCRDVSKHARIMWTTIVLCIALNAFHAYVYYWSDFPREEEADVIAEMARAVHDEAGLTDVSFVGFGNGDGYRWRLHLVLMCILFPGFYVVIVICMARIRAAINNMNTLKLKEYNLQVSAAMTFQAILPTLEIGAWCIQIFVPLFIHQSSTVKAIVYSDIPIHLIPVINPIGTILLVAPYRRAFFSYIGFKKAGSTIIRAASVVLRSQNRTVPAASNDAQRSSAIGAEAAAAGGPPAQPAPQPVAVQVDGVAAN